MCNLTPIVSAILPLHELVHAPPIKLFERIVPLLLIGTNTMFSTQLNTLVT
jgi:hypothetical protein